MTEEIKCACGEEATVRLGRDGVGICRACAARITDQQIEARRTVDRLKKARCNARRPRQEGRAELRASGSPGHHAESCPICREKMSPAAYDYHSDGCAWHKCLWCGGKCRRLDISFDAKRRPGLCGFFCSTVCRNKAYTTCAVCKTSPAVDFGACLPCGEAALARRRAAWSAWGNDCAKVRAAVRDQRRARGQG